MYTPNTHPALALTEPRSEMISLGAAVVTECTRDSFADSRWAQGTKREATG